MVEDRISGPEERSSGPRGCGKQRRSGGPAALAVLAIVVLGAAIGSIATKALADGPFGWGRPPFGGFMDGDRGPMDPAEIDKRVERAVKHVSVDIDATAEQQERLIAIAQGAAKDLLPIREEIGRTRERASELLSASTIDRAAIEQLRIDRMQKLDEATKRLSQALADAAEILTSEQRQQLVRRMEAFHERRSGWHRG